jgi:hypothetical protein
METDKIYNDISNLPPEARRQIVDFIDFLKIRYQKPLQAKTPQKGKITDSPFIGIWKNRKDMEDSTRWVRNLRGSEWGGTS